MNKKTIKQQLYTGCALLGMLIIIGSLEVVFSHYLFVEVVMLIAVIGCSLGVGAFIRELLLLKKSNLVDN